MRRLNDVASRAAVAVGTRCATDITGFGLVGHALHIANASDVTLVFDSELIPLLAGARDAWEQGIRTGGAERNEAYLRDRVEWGSAPESMRALVIDPQTSGGLLVAVPEGRVEEYLSAVMHAVEVGRVEARGAHGVALR
jgi:selenide,water dikinase